MNVFFNVELMGCLSVELAPADVCGFLFIVFAKP
jgi:hypothetical protein